jgi:uncharacterized membrane protein YcaP (DUF421 family)
MDISELLGPESGELELHHMLIRALLAYIISFILFRIAGLRTLGKFTFFDYITVLVLGSIIGRSIVTTQPFFESMLAVLLIVLLHRLTGYLAFLSKKFGALAKGLPLSLYKNGKYNRQNMFKSQITENDIEECTRLQGNVDDLSKIKEVILERSGGVSIIKND